MVVVGVRSVEKNTHILVICRIFEGLQIFDEVFVDLVPKVAQIPWGFGFGLMGPSL